MFKNKLIKLSSTEKSGITRFTENEPVECNINFVPVIGLPIIAYGKSLTDFGNLESVRQIITSNVIFIEDGIYTTETGSKYKIIGELN